MTCFVLHPKPTRPNRISHSPALSFFLFLFFLASFISLSRTVCFFERIKSFSVVLVVLGCLMLFLLFSNESCALDAWNVWINWSWNIQSVRMPLSGKCLKVVYSRCIPHCLWYPTILFVWLWWFSFSCQCFIYVLTRLGLFYRYI